MNTSRIQTIIDKEWIEVFKNRLVLFTVVFMPLLFTVLPLVMLNIFNNSGGVSGAKNTEIPPQFMQLCSGLTANDCMQYFLVNQFLLMFMLMPLIIPTAIAAYSIVGEKTTHSLEPLLATPITTTELLVAKALAAAIPAIGATWACFFLFAFLIPVAGGSASLMRMVLGPTWMIAVLIIGPLMAIASVNLAIIVSSRVNDPRAAEQISGILVVPVLLLLFGQVGGIIVINPSVMFITALVMVALDVVMVWLGSRLFQREVILTRWK